jgi:hypothetical protein
MSEVQESCRKKQPCYPAAGGYQGEGEGAAAAVELSGEEWARLEELLAEQVRLKRET